MITKHNVRARNIKLGDVIESFGTPQRVYAIGTFNECNRIHLSCVENPENVTDVTVPHDYVLVVQIPNES